MTDAAGRMEISRWLMYFYQDIPNIMIITFVKNSILSFYRKEQNVLVPTNHKPTKPNITHTLDIPCVT